MAAAPLNPSDLYDVSSLLSEEERMVHRFRLANIGAGGFPVARFVFVFLFQLVGAVRHDLTVLGVDSQR